MLLGIKIQKSKTASYFNTATSDVMNRSLNYFASLALQKTIDILLVNNDNVQQMRLTTSAYYLVLLFIPILL